MFVEGESGLEPAMVWLSESGLPMPHTTWQKIFQLANARCAAQGLTLNPPTGLWDRRLGPGGRWAGACVRAGAFWGVRDWSAGLVRLVAGGVRLRCAGR